MSIRQFLAGRTYSLAFNFFDDTGTRTSVDSPTANFYTPNKTIYSSPSLDADLVTIGKYTTDFYCASGLTYGHWFALAVGVTNNATLFSESVPFEVINITTEPFWVGLGEFREYMGESDEDHSKDSFYKQILQAAIEVIEAYTRRTFGVQSYSELIEVQSTDRIKLKHFPIVQIVGATATALITPMVISATGNDFTVLTSGVDSIPFYFTTDYNNGLLKLTDSFGFADSYNDVLLTIDYQAGFLSVPEPIRMATLALASKLSNMATSEGISSVRLADLSFSLDKEIIMGSIADLLAPYKIVDI